MIQSYSAKLLTCTICGVKLLSIDAGQPIEPLSLALFTEALQPALESIERHLHFELTSQIDCDGKGRNDDE